MTSINDLIDDFDINDISPPEPVTFDLQPKTTEPKTASSVQQPSYDLFKDYSNFANETTYPKITSVLKDISTNVPELSFESLKNDNVLLLKSNWIIQFRKYIYSILNSVYDSTDPLLAEPHRLTVSSEPLLKIWVRAFSDATFTADNYESMETVGDKLYGCALIKYFYYKLEGKVSQRELSNMNMYFGSAKFMAKMSTDLQLCKWILKSESVELNDKITSNLVESICGAIEIVCDAVQKHYLNIKNYEVAARCPSGYTAVYNFVKFYFEGSNVDLNIGAYGPSKTFITQIPDLFGLRGKWSVQKSTDRSSYTFQIFDNQLAISLSKAITTGTNSIERSILSLSGTKDVDEGRLSDTIVQELEKLGVTREWFDFYNNVSRVDSITPEDLKSKFIEKYRSSGYSKPVFEFSTTDDVLPDGSKNATVILYGVKRDATDTKGTKTERHLLYSINGKIWDNDFIDLKNETARQWVFSTKLNNINSVSALKTHISLGLKPNYIPFYGHKSKTNGSIGLECFSQFYLTDFIIDGIKYNSTEMWMMASKARLFNDNNTLEMILASTNPSDIKALGRKVTPFDPESWYKIAFDIVVFGNFMKFSQNLKLKQVLLSTGDSVLVEAAPRDLIWGVGVGSEKAALGPDYWRGTNLLGFALMVARQHILEGTIPKNPLLTKIGSDIDFDM